MSSKGPSTSEPVSATITTASTGIAAGIPTASAAIPIVPRFNATVSASRPMATSAPARVPGRAPIVDKSVTAEAPNDDEIEDKSAIFGTKPPTDKKRVNPWGW
jgi:hypothetical protein